MDIFYREARAALISSSPSRPSQEGGVDNVVTGQKLLTPDSWNNSSSAGETHLKNVSPKAPTTIHESSESTPITSSETPISNSKFHVSGLRTVERPIQSLLHPPAMEVPPQPALIHPSPPLRNTLEHQTVPQIPMPFIRPPLHAQGLKSPLGNPLRNPGPASSPIHRPAHSPHMQPPTSSSVNPTGLIHPFPAAYFPGLHSPPLNMMPRGPVPVPPIMNFGIPSFSPLLPQPTVLVPYPIIVPLPVPIPIPIPIPLPSKPTLETHSHSGVIQPVPDGVDRCRSRATRLPSPGIPEVENRLISNKLSGTLTQGLPSPGDPSTRDTDWVKSENSFPAPTSAPHSGASSPRGQYNESPFLESEVLTDYKQPQSERQVIQWVLQRTQMKLGPCANGGVGPVGMEETETGWATRSGLHEIIRPTAPQPQSPSHDNIQHHQDSFTSAHTPPSPTRSSHLYIATSSALPPQDHLKNLNGMSLSSTPTSPESPISHRVPVPTSDPALSELESIKENKCSAVGPVRVDGPVSQSEEPLAVVGEVGQDPHVPDEDHAYALPTAPKTGGTATPLLLPKLRDKGSLRSPVNIPNVADMEPALKRRCLRIRDQNK